ncbi:MAG TPA: hypothetical protein VIZ68_02645 [Thermoplasmata archaeon]
MTGRPSGSPSADRESPPASAPEVVFLDANAFFLPLSTGFPLEEEVRRWAAPARVVVWSGTIAELERLGRRSVPRAEAALALARRFPVVESSGRGDQGLMELAARSNAWVVTSDRRFCERLVGEGVTVLFPRERARLALRKGRRPVSSSAASRPRAMVKNRPPLDRSHRRRRGDAAR